MLYLEKRAHRIIITLIKDKISKDDENIFIVFTRKSCGMNFIDCASFAKVNKWSNIKKPVHIRNSAPCYGNLDLIVTEDVNRSVSDP